jgi:hypothetical protein
MFSIHPCNISHFYPTYEDPFVCIMFSSHPSNICCPYWPNDEDPIICIMLSSSSFQHSLSVLSKWWTYHLFASSFQRRLSLLSKWWTSHLFASCYLKFILPTFVVPIVQMMNIPFVCIVLSSSSFQRFVILIVQMMNIPLFAGLYLHHVFSSCLEHCYSIWSR